MNYVNIMGGLGNQLFQYTFAKYLETHSIYPVTLHTGFYDINTKETRISSRKCALDWFNIQYSKTNEQIRYEYLFTDDTFESTSIKDNSIFNGYWQNKKFYSAVQDLISKELKLRHEFITEDMKEMATAISSCDSVAIHVRRKDYLNQYNKDIFYEISIEYYISAVQLISESLGHKPILYIFSDDYDYISSHMNNFCGCSTVLMAPRKDYEDLYLMSQAKHHIIANSTFSWWGSVLSDYSEGITIAPKHWFKDRRDPELYPDKWIIIDNQIKLDKISVIIPAYNVENYIDRCLESIEKQTYDINNIEVILINDASTDNTLKHLKAFEEKYSSNVILINLENNGGQGAARNLGLDYSTGEYICFVDSDDLINVSTLYKMIIKAKKYDCDIVECGFSHFSKESDIIITKDLDESFYLDLSEYTARKKLIMLTCSKTSVWGRLYKRDFILRNRLRFLEHLFFEDIQFSGLVMFMARSYYRINETLYHYFFNNSGTVFSSYKSERVRQELTATEKYLGELYDRGMLDYIIKNFRNELSIYCTTKAFIDPLTLLVHSNLNLDELLSETEYYKEKLLDLFPDAASSYNLSDKFDICALGIHLLKSDESMTKKLFAKASTDENVIINLCNDRELSADIYSDLISILPDIATSDRVNIMRSHYIKEHLLIRHALSKNNTIIVIAGRYLSVTDQLDIDKFLLSIINEYPDNRIVLMLEDLYYDESNICLNDLSALIECIKLHNNITVIMRNADAYSVGCALLSSENVYLMRSVSSQDKTSFSQ